jgi:glycosyltransferase involved in cell wall biosynthesis
LRIAQIHWAFPPTIGGVETHLCILMPELIRRGHRVRLLTGAEKGAPAHDAFQGAGIIRSPYMSLSYLLQHDPERLRPEITAMLVDFLNDFKPDVVHAHNLHYFTPVHAQVLAGLCQEQGLPLVLTAHNAWDDMLFLELSRDIPWDHIIAVSHYVKRELVGVGCPDNRITVIHHGIDPGQFHPDVDTAPVYQRFPQLKGKTIIFHPARMGMAKGNDVVVKAFRLVHEAYPDAILVLAGSERIVDWEQKQSGDIRYVLNLIKRFNLRQHTLIDVFRLEEMPAMYAASQVVVYPSTAPEPFGLTLLEATATARPIIVSNAGGMPEVIRDGINGFVVPIRDPESLAARIGQLLGDGHLRSRIGQTGRTIVMDHFNKELMTKNHIAVYRRTLDSQRTREQESLLASLSALKPSRPLARVPLYNQ